MHVNIGQLLCDSRSYGNVDFSISKGRNDRHSNENLELIHDFSPAKLSAKAACLLLLQIITNHASDCKVLWGIFNGRDP